MRFLELKEKLKDFTVFSIHDIRKIEPSFYRQRLNEWRIKGYIKKVIRGHYIFSDLVMDEAALFVLANRIYEPSYISLEMAMSFYNLIPEGVYSITSVSTRKTSEFKTEIGNFSYRKITPAGFFGYTLVERSGSVYKIAEMEKVILDYLYFNPRLVAEDDFSELRLNREILREKMDIVKFNNYLRQYKNRQLEKRAAAFLKFIK